MAHLVTAGVTQGSFRRRAKIQAVTRENVVTEPRSIRLGDLLPNPVAAGPDSRPDDGLYPSVPLQSSHTRVDDTAEESSPADV